LNVALNRLLSATLAVVLPLSVWAHGGEDHGEQAAPAAVTAAAPRLITHTDQFELVGVLQGQVLTLYLDVVGTNTPVAKAQMELESGTWKAVATEVAPAVYTVPAEFLAQPGKHTLAITVQAGDATDLMDATLDIGQTHTPAPPAHFWSGWNVWPFAASPQKIAVNAPTSDAPSALRLPDGSLFVPKAVQRQLGIRTVRAEVKDLAATIELNGRVMADPNAGGRVQASQGGRIEAGPKGLPVLGQKVVKGQVLSWLRPSIGSVERGNQRAALADIESQLAIATAKAARYAQLEGAVPQKDIAASRWEVDALQKRRAAVVGSLGEAEALLAPASGVVSAINLVNGQVVEARETLLEIIDPARLSVEALAYDPALVNGIQSASVPLSGGALELQFVGGGRQLREQALPLLFRVKSQNAPVAVGQPVKVIVKTSRTTKGVAVPQASVARNSAGDTVVWVHIAPERFAQRRVNAQPLDASAVALSTGIVTGERVVTDGANLLAQVR
jgi:hypothetical protein